MQDKKTLNLTETAQHIGVSKRKLHYMLSSRSFPVDPVPGFYPRRWSVAALDAWLTQGDLTAAKG